MDLKRLRTFLMVAESGSLSRASDRLRIAQPALSRQIRMLEDELGFQLFIRSGRGMTLTGRGALLLERVSGLIEQLEATVDDVRSLPDEPTGRVTLGLIPTVSFVVAGRIAVRAARELPQVSLRLVEGYAGHLIDWLHRGEIDLAVLYGPAADLHLRLTDLMFEELVLVGPADDGAGEAALPVAALAGRDLILPSHPHGLRIVVENAAAKAGVAINVRFEADSFHALKEMVAAGLGHTVLPLSAFYREQTEGVFRLTRLTKPKVARQLVLALPSGRMETAATGAVHRLILDEIRAARGGGAWRSPDD